MSPAQAIPSPFFPPLYSLALCEQCSRPAGRGQPDRNGRPICPQCVAEDAECERQAALVQAFVSETVRPLLRREFARLLQEQALSKVNSLSWLFAEELCRQRDELEDDFYEVITSAAP